MGTPVKLTAVECWLRAAAKMARLGETQTARESSVYKSRAGIVGSMMMTNTASLLVVNGDDREGRIHYKVYATNGYLQYKRKPVWFCSLLEIVLCI